MFPSMLPSAQHPFQPLILDINSRRLLLHTPLPATGPAAASNRGTATPGSFDSDAIMILAVLMCAIICVLGAHSIIRCTLRCSGQTAVEPEPNPVGQPSARARRRALRSLPTIIYSDQQKLAGDGSECAICLSDFVPGERIRVLPKCNHGFHAACVDRWLMARTSCPTCRHCLCGLTQKASGCGEVGRPGPARSTMIMPIIMPLEPENFIGNYS